MHHAAQLTVPSCAVDPATLRTPCDLAVPPCTCHPSAARPFRPRCHGLVPMQQGAARNDKVSGWFVCPLCTPPGQSPPCTHSGAVPALHPGAALALHPPGAVLALHPGAVLALHPGAAVLALHPAGAMLALHPGIVVQEANHQFGRWGRRERRQLGSMATL
jgi:hypothetical protein